GFAWTCMERVAPKAPRRPRPDVLAIRCPMATKEMLLETAPDRFFDDDHYRGYPAVLVRLDAIGEDELTALLRGGWRAVAPRPLVKRVEAA
ncbi:MAG: MmcQ/YjbR family DNA-binding protein, partial [Phenylobacterium sp.]